MHFQYTIPLPQPAPAVWDALSDHIRLIKCLPGCQSVTPADPTADTAAYDVRLATGIGPIRLQVSGRAEVESAAELQTLTAKVRLGDGRAGTIHGTFVLRTQPAADGQAAVDLSADVVLAGKLGEFGVALMRRKADQTVQEFAANLQRRFFVAAT